MPFGCKCDRKTQGEPQRRGGEATVRSIIKEVQIIQKEKEMPHDGGIVLPENVHVKPFHSKG
jgi:hypothetical protein